MDPDLPDDEKSFPVPLQAVALVLVQVRVDDRGYHIEAGDAERLTVGDSWLACVGAVAACATAIAEALVGWEGAPTFCCATSCRISCSGGVAVFVEAGISVAFDGMLALGVELTTCPEAISGKTSKPRLIVASTEFRNMRLYLC
jgi:hypothetical protein